MSGKKLYKVKKVDCIGDDKEWIVGKGCHEKTKKSPKSDKKSPKAEKKSPKSDKKSPKVGKKLSKVKKADCIGDDKEWIVGKGCHEKAKKSPVKKSPVKKSPKIVKKSGSVGCVEKTEKKYKDRPSPPYSAQDCQGEIMKGNDGNLYESKPNVKGVYAWKILKTTHEKEVKDVKDVKDVKGVKGEISTVKLTSVLKHLMQQLWPSYGKLITEEVAEKMKLIIKQFLNKYNQAKKKLHVNDYSPKVLELALNGELYKHASLAIIKSNYDNYKNISKELIEITSTFVSTKDEANKIATVLEYLFAEILELSGSVYAEQDNYIQSFGLVPCIKDAIKADTELSKLFSI